MKQTATGQRVYLQVNLALRNNLEKVHSGFANMFASPIGLLFKGIFKYVLLAKEIFTSFCDFRNRAHGAKINNPSN
jgi:hypothetical protein